jgi:hypothetical protein
VNRCTLGRTGPRVFFWKNRTGRKNPKNPTESLLEHSL